MSLKAAILAGGPEHGSTRSRPVSQRKIAYFEEKPVLKEYPVSMGIDILDSDALSYCKPNTDLTHHVIPDLLKDGKPVYAYLTDRRHYDIGTFKTLDVRDHLEQGKDIFRELEEMPWLPNGAARDKNRLFGRL
jgi:NDP-sugar pyrophosphorylase family protein